MSTHYHIKRRCTTLLHYTELLSAENVITTSLAHNKLKYGSFSKIASLHNSSLPNCQNLCSVCSAYTDTKHHWLTATSTMINQLVKLHPLIDQTCFEFINVSYFVVCYYQHRIFNTTKLLNHAAPSVELMMQI